MFSLHLCICCRGSQQRVEIHISIKFLSFCLHVGYCWALTSIYYTLVILITQLFISLLCTTLYFSYQFMYCSFIFCLVISSFVYILHFVAKLCTDPSFFTQYFLSLLYYTVFHTSIFLFIIVIIFLIYTFYC